MKRVGKTFLTSVKAKTRIIMGLARKPQVVWYGHLKTLHCTGFMCYVQKVSTEAMASNLLPLHIRSQAE